MPQMAFSGFISQLPDSRNSGNRSLGMSSRVWFCLSFIAPISLLFIRAQPGNLAPLGELVQYGRDVFHQGQFLLGAGFPAQPQRSQQIAKVFTVEDAAA